MPRAVGGQGVHEGACAPRTQAASPASWVSAAPGARGATSPGSGAPPEP